MAIGADAPRQLLRRFVLGHIHSVGGKCVALCSLCLLPPANLGVGWRMRDDHAVAGIVQGTGDGSAQAPVASCHQSRSSGGIHG